MAGHVGVAAVEGVRMNLRIGSKCQVLSTEDWELKTEDCPK